MNQGSYLPLEKKKNNAQKKCNLIFTDPLKIPQVTTLNTSKALLSMVSAQGNLILDLPGV